METKTITLRDFTVLNDIEAKLQAITPTLIDMVSVRLGQPKNGEEVVGVVSDACKALFALTFLLRSELEMEKALAGQLAEPEIVNDHKQRAMIADQLCDVALELTWAQARTDTGYWQVEDVGMREGWALVSLPAKRPGPDALMAFIKAGMQPPE